MLLKDLDWQSQFNDIEMARVPMTECRQLLIWRETKDKCRLQVQVVRRNMYLHNHWPLDALEAQCLLNHYLAE